MFTLLYSYGRLISWEGRAAVVGPADGGAGWQWWRRRWLGPIGADIGVDLWGRLRRQGWSCRIMTNSGLTYPAAISASCPSRQPFSTARISRPTTYQGSATFCPVWVAGHLARPMTDGRPRPRGLADFNKAPTRCSSGTSDTRKTSLKMHLFSYLYTYTYTHAYMCVSLFLYVCVKLSSNVSLCIPHASWTYWI